MIVLVYRVKGCRVTIEGIYIYYTVIIDSPI